MKNTIIFLLTVWLGLPVFSQKKPLDHNVYDGWQSLGERAISKDGNYVFYTVNPQEGDGLLVITSKDSLYKMEIPRGYNGLFTADSRFLICRIKPCFKDSREAKIKKKKPDEMPRDSLVIIELGKDLLVKKAGIKSYRIPQHAGGWLAFLHEKGYPEQPQPKPPVADSATRIRLLARTADSLSHLADSLKAALALAREKGLGTLPVPRREPRKSPEEPVEEGTLLVLRNLYTGEERSYPRVKDYLMSKNGKELVMAVTRTSGDSLSTARVLWLHLGENRTDTVMKGFNETRNFCLDEQASQLAFVAERDSAAKALRKTYKLWYYKGGMDSARMLADTRTLGVPRGQTVSENYPLHFSRQGQRLFFGLAPIRAVKDTTLPDFEKAGLDIWNYRDDELQSVQLKNLERDLKKSWVAMCQPSTGRLVPLGSEKFPDVLLSGEGDGTVFYGSSDSGRRVEKQWQGYTLSDVWAIDPQTGERKLVQAALKGTVYPSYSGKYLVLYDDRKGKYTVYNSLTGSLHALAPDVHTRWNDEENDMPDDPAPYGIAGWEKNDLHIYLYDRYNIWRADPDGREKSTLVNDPGGRPGGLSFRYVQVDPEEKSIDPDKYACWRVYNERTKLNQYLYARPAAWQDLRMIASSPDHLIGGLQKADSAEAFLYTAENFQSSPNLFVTAGMPEKPDHAAKAGNRGWYSPMGQIGGLQLSHLNPQQAGYLWGSAELFTWKAYTGKQTEGVLYKPENFDPSKKYPMIVYFYERNNNTLYNYLAPAPTPSRLNIPFFVSRGYLVFVPDIWYRNGHPGKSAYDYVVSGTRSLISRGFVDSTRIGLQGQSWGGYQTAYIITQTRLYAAAWAGAPVVNMFSAYGGIRWESGLNRQMQYEHSQSRIGATIWERPDLYVENSPLFHLPAVKTPLVIMSNDADGAVPWYQGIEFFTAMRRLHKPVWLLVYNGEAHNLVERRNRKDIQIREQQFFDWLLKGEKPPLWIERGVPATLKGIDWGTGLP